MLNRFLGIDNCIGCSELLRLPDQLRCKKYKEIINKDCFSIPLKLEYCQMPFKYDSKLVKLRDEEVVN